MAHSQNLTVTVSERTTGGYKCHAETLGFDSVETNMAEILLTGIPVITSPSAQAGIVGEDAHIDCNARSVPMADDVVWKYHGVTIDDGGRIYSFKRSEVFAKIARIICFGLCQIFFKDILLRV